MKRWIPGFLIVLTGLVVSSWPSHPAAASGPEPSSVTIFFSGFVRGNFGPCGCVANPAGGLARRAGFSGQYAEKTGDAVLQVDLGNYFKPLGPHSKAVNELMAEGLQRLPIEVMNLTPEDLYFWGELQRMELPTRIISTNLTPRNASLGAPSRYAVVSIPAARLNTGEALRIGFLGVSDPLKVKPNSGFVGNDPVAAVSAAAEELAGKVDFIVVLADIDVGPGPFREDSLPARIARAHDRIYAVLVAEKRYILRTPLQVNNAVLLSSVERGRHLGRLTFGLDRLGNVTDARPEFIELKEGVPTEPYFLERQRQLEKVLPDP